MRRFGRRIGRRLRSIATAERAQNLARELLFAEQQQQGISSAPRRRRRVQQSSFMGPMVAAPLATASSAISRVANSTKQGKVEVVSHSELVATIEGSTAFAVNKFVVQPGLTAVFPWLATQAQRYQQYRVRSMFFELLTRTGASTQGSVIIAPDYDATNPPPETEEQVTAYQGAVEDVPWKNIKTNLDPGAIHATGPRKFIRSGAVPDNLTTYDACNLFVCTTGMVDTAAVGKLWVHYEIELHVPQIVSPNATPSCYFYAIAAPGQTIVAGANALELSVEQNTFEAVFDGKDNSLQLPKGAFQIIYNADVGGVWGLSNSWRAFPGTDVKTPLSGSEAEFFSSAASTAQRQLSTVAYFMSDGTTKLYFVVDLTAVTSPYLDSLQVSIVCV